MQTSDSTAIKVKDISKDFVLPHERVSTVKGLFTNVYRKRSKTSETQHALHKVSFEIKKGEFFGIVGRNGSGKSTLLKILAGIYQPTEGEVFTTGKIVPFIELGVGFNPELTGRENVYLNGALLGFSRKEIDHMYGEIVAFAELEKFMDQKLKNYSSGMQVRLAFSMAIRSEADILLVDEVLAVGDADFQRKCFDYFRAVRKKKITVILVTHDMSSVREYCDRAILIEKSKLVAEGTADEVATKYTKLFLETEETSLPGDQNDEKRWGDMKVATVRATVSPKKVERSQKLTVTHTIKARQDVESVVCGFSIRNSDGKIICGTNTLLQRQHIGTLKAGESRMIKWTLPDLFSDGGYTVDVAINHANGIDVHDWWEEVAKFRVFKEDRPPYLINPQLDLKIEE